MRIRKMYRRIAAGVLAMMLFMSSGLEALLGTMAFAMDEETIVETEENTASEATTPVPTEAPTPVPTEMPTPVPTEVPAEPTAVPPEGTMEATAEATAIPEATEEAPAEPKATEETEMPTPEPVPAETPAAAEAPALEPAEVPSEELHFTKGYVRLEKGSVVYERTKKAEKLGTLKAKGIVYAELVEENADPAEDWLRITFDTQALRESDMEFAVGYVQYKTVEALSDEETVALLAELESDPGIRFGKYYVPCVALEEEAAPTELPEMTDAPESEADALPAEQDEAAARESDRAAERLGQTAADSVNVRSAATTQSECVTTIAEAGTEVAVTGEIEVDGAVWYAIRFGEYVGYIRSDLIEIVAEETELQPEADTDAEAAAMLSDPSADAPAATEIIGVWYDKGIEERPLQIHVTTSLDAQYLYLYQGEKLLASWQADEAKIDESATNKEWHVSYTFAYSGAYYLWYKASTNGTAMSDAYSPAPVQIERPAVIDVWYEKGIEGKPLKIHATTNLAMQHLYLYLGDDQIASWSAEDAEIVKYATCKEWVVEHTFSDPGTYYLWYKASEDGTEMSLPYSPAAVQIERPAVIEVWYEKGIEGKPLKIHATTNLAMQHLYLYLGDDQIASWSAEDAELVEYATCKEWVVEHTFADPGAYYLWYKASADGTELSQAYAPAAAQIERPAVIEVWYEEAKAGTPLKIHATTNLAMQHLYLYLGDAQLAAWTAEGTTIAEYATCKEWTVEYTLADEGAYYLWYKASKDGTTEELPFAPDPVYIAASDELAAPKWKSIEQEGLTAVLKWQAVEGADGYEISMSEGASEEYRVIGETTGATTLTTDDLTVGTTYVFRVRAYEMADGVKKLSNRYSEAMSITIEEPRMTEGSFEYAYNAAGNGIVITNYTGSETTVTVPDTIQSMPVVEIGERAFEGNASLREINLPDTITKIGYRAFAGCANLKTMH